MNSQTASVTQTGEICSTHGIWHPIGTPCPSCYPIGGSAKHADLCPVCMGRGELGDSANTGGNICYGCGGKGWVKVG